MKDIGSFFSVKDFFNYYIAGWLWLVDFMLIVFLLNIVGIHLDLMGFLKTQSDTLGPIISGISVVIFPYVMGFVASPLCYKFAKEYRTDHGDATVWVTDHFSNSSQNTPTESTDKKSSKADNKENEAGEHTRLSKSATIQIAHWAHVVFPALKRKIKDDPASHFFYIRAYVADKGGGAAEYARRAEDLMNFTESLLIPAPLLFSLSSFILFNRIITEASVGLWCNTLVLLFSILVYMTTFKTVAERYLGFREYWVKHTYRAFLVIEAREREHE